MPAGYRAGCENIALRLNPERARRPLPGDGVPGQNRIPAGLFTLSTAGGTAGREGRVRTFVPLAAASTSLLLAGAGVLAATVKVDTSGFLKPDGNLLLPG